MISDRRTAPSFQGSLGRPRTLLLLISEKLILFMFKQVGSFDWGFITGANWEEAVSCDGGDTALELEVVGAAGPV